MWSVFRKDLDTKGSELSFCHHPWDWLQETDSSPGKPRVDTPASPTNEQRLIGPLLHPWSRAFQLQEGVYRGTQGSVPIVVWWYHLTIVLAFTSHRDILCNDDNVNSACTSSCTANSAATISWMTKTMQSLFNGSKLKNGLTELNNNLELSTTLTWKTTKNYKKRRWQNFKEKYRKKGFIIKVRNY